MAIHADDGNRDLQVAERLEIETMAFLVLHTQFEIGNLISESV